VRDVWGLPRDRWWVYAILAAVLVASAAIPYASLERAPVVCPLRAVTSLECPGCGLTRSFVATADGHLGVAYGHHPLGTALLSLLAVMITTRVVFARSERTLFPDGPAASWPVRMVVFAWVAWAVGRNLG